MTDVYVYEGPVRDKLFVSDLNEGDFFSFINNPYLYVLTETDGELYMCYSFSDKRLVYFDHMHEKFKKPLKKHENIEITIKG